MNQRTPAVLCAEALTHKFRHGTIHTTAVEAVNITFAPGSFTAIMGRSGSGKSTLLYCLAGLIRPTEGKVTFDGVDLAQVATRRLNQLWRDDFGFIFQQFNLIDALTAVDNVRLPSLFGRHLLTTSEATAALRRVGLLDAAHRYPGELSGGQQQRVAVARALARPRRVVFADEPTGALDQASGWAVLDLFTEFTATGTTVVMVTHDPGVAARADRVLFLHDGALRADLTRPSVREISDLLVTWEVP